MTTDAIAVPSPRTELRNYTRWQRTAPDGDLRADILGTGLELTVRPHRRAVVLDGRELTPDEARLIDAAVLADGASAIRETPS